MINSDNAEFAGAIYLILTLRASWHETSTLSWLGCLEHLWTLDMITHLPKKHHKLVFLFLVFLFLLDSGQPSCQGCKIFSSALQGYWLFNNAHLVISVEKRDKPVHYGQPTILQKHDELSQHFSARNLSLGGTIDLWNKQGLSVDVGCDLFNLYIKWLNFHSPVTSIIHRGCNFVASM